MNLKTYLKTTKTSQSELARRLGVTQGMIWQWITKHRPVSAEMAIPIEKATDGKVTRYELRPDIYPRDAA